MSDRLVGGRIERSSSHRVAARRWIIVARLPPLLRLRAGKCAVIPYAGDFNVSSEAYTILVIQIYAVLLTAAAANAAS